MVCSQTVGKGETETNISIPGADHSRKAGHETVSEVVGLNPAPLLLLMPSQVAGSNTPPFHFYSSSATKGTI